MTPKRRPTGCSQRSAGSVRASRQRRAEAQAKIEQIRQFTVAELEPVRDRLKETEKALLKLMKAERKAIFDGNQKVTLEHGILIHTRELKVSIPRDALKKIKELEWTEAIKVAESLDRGVVEKWPDERLFPDRRGTEGKAGVEVGGIS